MENAIIGLYMVIALLVIAVIICFISRFNDFKKRKYIHDGYICVEPNYIIKFIVPALSFICAAALVFAYARYMHNHPTLCRFIIYFIMLLSLIAIFYTYILRSKRLFYTKDRIIIDRPFIWAKVIEPSEISRFSYTVKSYFITVSIETLTKRKQKSRRVRRMNSMYIGFHDFYIFTKIHWENKMKIQDKRRKSKRNKEMNF